MCFFPPLDTVAGSLVLRHSGVLGLAALVEAYPYTVPDWLPEVLDNISVHLNDPAPINVSMFCNSQHCVNNRTI